MSFGRAQRELDGASSQFSSNEGDTEGALVDWSSPLPPHFDGASAKESSDRDLLKMLAQGDKIAMGEFYARHKERVWRFACRLVNDEALAEDVTSEVFMLAWRNA